MKRSEMDRVPKGFWRCRRQQGGVKCLALNPKRKQICEKCGKRRPKTSKPKHMVVLDEMTYEQFIDISCGERCEICGSPPKAKRLARDHDHKTGKARGLLCFRDNTLLPRDVNVDWAWEAWRYLMRHDLMDMGRLQWVEEDRGHATKCWVWQRAKHSAGYGVINHKGQVLYVHRIMHRGPIPDGYHVDHLCMQKDCVNPAHLEAVTGKENSVRYAQAQETCKRGHLWTEENTYWRKDIPGTRQCRACIKMRTQGEHLTERELPY